MRLKIIHTDTPEAAADMPETAGGRPGCAPLKEDDFGFIIRECKHGLFVISFIDVYTIRGDSNAKKEMERIRKFNLSNPFEKKIILAVYRKRGGEIVYSV